MRCKTKQVIAVVQVSDGKVMYCGKSLSRAAVALEPGTVYGVASDKSGISAKKLAVANAEEHRQRLKNLGYSVFSWGMK